MALMPKYLTYGCNYCDKWSHLIILMFIYLLLIFACCTFTILLIVRLKVERTTSMINEGQNHIESE